MADETEAQSPKNTPAQEAFIQAQADAWEEEKNWPLYEVKISGDEAVWKPRADERFWRQENPDDPTSGWVPKDESEIAPDSGASVNEGGEIVMVATATVQCHARSEEHAKMLALRDNPTYHTVESVREMKTS